MDVLYNFIWILLSYLIGSVNFSIIFTKYNLNKDIRKVGSGNAGSTNVARVYGFKLGLVVFILDVSKSYWLGFLAGMLQRYVGAFSGLIPQLCLVFVIIGHIFPIYFGFKGGKGAAALFGMVSAISLILATIGIIIFSIIVYYSKYVSLGSIITPFILVFVSFLIPFWNHFDSPINYGPFWLTPLLLFVSWIIVASSHWQNIIRLIQKKENKTSLKILLSKEKAKKTNTQEIDYANIDTEEIADISKINSNEAFQKRDLSILEEASSNDTKFNL